MYLSPTVRADVSPAEFAAELEPGQSVTVTKTVTLPEDTPKLDLLLLVDLSGSYGDDLPNIKGLAPSLFDNIRHEIPDSRFGLATFVDFPFSPWGSSAWGDYAYRLDQDLTDDKTAWVNAINAMTTSSGADLPESQYEGLYQAVSGVGREMPPTTNGYYGDLGEIEPGANATFRADATKVIAITTDAAFHEGGDFGYSFPYPGATQAETIAALNAAGVKVIAIRAPGSGTEMQQVADATGGAVVFTDSSSSEIATAVLDGIESLLYTVSADATACAPLEIGYTPASHADIPSGTAVSFEETITVPTSITAGDLDADGKIVCSVDFLADDTVIGTQTVEITVPLNNPPVAVCQDLALAADSTCSASGSVDGGSFDPDGDAIFVDVSMPSPYPVGAHTVTLTVTDEWGESDSCEALVTVVDATPPVVTLAEPLELWPPNHKYADLSLADCVESVTDSCSGAIDILSVGYVSWAYSDEPEDAAGGGDGSTLDDILFGEDGVSFSVRKERQGGGNGRVYGVVFGVSDGAGNVSEATCTVSVPHSGDGTAAIDDGAAAGYIVN